jgi:hypothetical protein
MATNKYDLVANADPGAPKDEPIAPNAKDLANTVVRAHSFIDAAILMVENSGLEGSALTKVKAELNGKRTGFNEKSVTEHEKVSENGVQGLKGAVTSLNKELVGILQGALPEISKDDIEEQLLNAESHLNWKPRLPIVSVMDARGELLGRSNPKFPKIEGSKAFEYKDAHGQWKGVDSIDAMKDSLIAINCKEEGKEFKLATRMETPIVQLTTAQEDSWHAIHGADKPEWFTDLPEWEQKHLVEKTKEWHNTAEADGQNLGDIIGSPPSTVRRYPGAPNSYVTSLTMDTMTRVDESLEGTSKVLYEKVRSGALIPFDIEDKKVALEITKQNLEQLVADTISRKIAEAIKANPDAARVDIPLAIQTLFSPPAQPEGGDAILATAVANVKKQINQPEYLKKIGVVVPVTITVNCDASYTNMPVNTARGLAKVYNLFRPGVNSSSQGLLSGFKAKDAKLAFEAEQALNSHVSNEVILGTFNKPIKKESNEMTEKAALEQILTHAKGGNRIGSCVSGKDREEMVTEMAIAMVMYRDIHGELPPPPGSKSKFKEGELKGTSKRDEFENIVARQFLTNHGQQIAAANSVGSDGLKNVDEVYGNAICKKIGKLADTGNYEGFDKHAIKRTKAVAGLNKPMKDPSMPFWKKALYAIPAVVAALVVAAVVLVDPVIQVIMAPITMASNAIWDGSNAKKAKEMKKSEDIHPPVLTRDFPEVVAPRVSGSSGPATRVERVMSAPAVRVEHEVSGPATRVSASAPALDGNFFGSVPVSGEMRSSLDNIRAELDILKAEVGQLKLAQDIPQSPTSVAAPMVFDSVAKNKDTLQQIAASVPYVKQKASAPAAPNPTTTKPKMDT